MIYIPKPYDVKKLGETATWSTGAAFNFANSIPNHKDILGIFFDFTCQVDSHTTVTKTPDNMYQLIANLIITGDGEEIMNLRDVELKWLSWLMTGEKPEEMESPDATSQTDKVAYVRFYLPLGIKVGAYKHVKVKGTWGATADPDGGATFVVDSAVLTLTVFLGKAPTAYYTKLHEPPAASGVKETPIPKGNLKAIIMQDDARADYVSNVKLKFSDKNVIDADYETLRGMAKQIHGINMFGPDDVDAQKETGIIIIDAQDRSSDGANALLEYTITTSTIVYVLYLYSKNNY